jgi:hypothetical protein
MKQQGLILEHDFSMYLEYLNKVTAILYQNIRDIDQYSNSRLYKEKTVFSS